MARASDYIKVSHPIDVPNFDFDVQSLNTEDFTPGTLVVPNANGLVEKAIATTAAHRVTPRYIVNIDVAKRADANNIGLTPGGVRRDQVTTIRAAGARARIHVTRCFDATVPALGMLVTLSLTAAGKFAAYTPAGLDTALDGASITNEFDRAGVIVGRVEGPVDNEGYVTVCFTT